MESVWFAWSSVLMPCLSSVMFLDYTSEGMLYKLLSFLCIPAINYKSVYFFNQQNKPDLVARGTKIYTL